MSYYIICPNCGKGTIGRYATDNSLCGECSDNSITTDKLSVEKLQEHLLPYKKETVQKIIDEKMQLVTADEFLKLHKEYLTAIRENGKLQEQLNTAKKALTEIAETKDFYRSGRDHWEEFSQDALKAQKALAAIGGDDE
ncbi:hypothetical protein KB529_03420 [Lactococcus lactis subsp. lactis]|uniref:hypothetical protein n=1 Tax=Lactococcus lactis TaxID=1358 RepID=UPI001BB03ACB|nr:hypothetical protein [Lactococcus lactis]MBS3729599.1 hypothetical protein [Lactococcus lactis subsp. lactis]